MLPGEAYKVYVSVFVEHRSDGTMLPREIIWEDGQKYEIAVSYTHLTLPTIA